MKPSTRRCLAVAAALALLACVACEPTKQYQVPPPAAAETSDLRAERLRSEAAAEELAATELCKTTLSARMEEYRKFMALNKFDPAGSTLRRCSQLLRDPKLKALVAESEIKSSTSIIDATSNSAAQRIDAYELLARDYPDAAKRYAKIALKLAPEAAQHRALLKQLHRFDTMPRLGMRSAQVLETWGHPGDMNNSTNIYGVRSQWVYREAKYGKSIYLYFENDVLTSMQD